MILRIQYDDGGTRYVNLDNVTSVRFFPSGVDENGKEYEAAADVVFAAHDSTLRLNGEYAEAFNHALRSVSQEAKSPPKMVDNAIQPTRR